MHTLRYQPIPSDFYQNNRNRLAAQLPAGSLVIVHANDIYPTNADGTLAHHQNATSSTSPASTRKKPSC